MNAFLPSAPAAEPAAHDPLPKLVSIIQRHPAQTVATAFALGLLCKLLPRRATATLLGRAVLRFLPPALASLGVAKALELCSQVHAQPHAARPSPPP